MALLTSLMSTLILLPLALSQCPSNGRIGPDKQCYAAYNSTCENCPMGWTNAAEYCSKLNGQLVSIHDAFVNAFLWDWSKETWVGDIWIGLWCSVSTTNDQFSWLDKSKYDYKNWMKSAPTNCTEFGNSCAYMQSKDGKWTTYLMCDSLANSFISRPVPSDLYLGIFSFLDGKEVQKCQLVSKVWNSFIMANYSSLPIYEFYCFQLNNDGRFVQRLTGFSSGHWEHPWKQTDAKNPPNKKFIDVNQLKPHEKRSEHRYLIRYFEIFNGNIMEAFQSFKKVLKFSKFPIKVVELYADQNNHKKYSMQEFIWQLNSILKCYLSVEYLHLKLNGLVIGEISANYANPRRVNIWKDFRLKPFYKQLSIIWPINADSKEFVEWMGFHKWAPKGSKNRMEFVEAILLENFIKEYIEFFLKTKNPIHMFREVGYGSDAILKIPFEYLSENNISCRIIQRRYWKGYRYFVETDETDTYRQQALIEAVRPDGFILRILTNSVDQACGATFKIYHKNIMPRPNIPEDIVFPIEQRQLGFDYVNTDGQLI